MSLFFSYNALVVVLLIWLGLGSASSLPARPLKRVVHPTTLALEILPRQSPASRSLPTSTSPHSPILLHSDTFRLTLSAFNTVYHLHLRPNDNLIHPSARVNYYRTSPTTGASYLHRTEPLLRANVKAYWGEVVPTDSSPARMREDAAGVLPRPAGVSELGWARIIVHHQGDIDAGIAPVFEGAFSVHGVVHHVSTRTKYLQTKHPLDPELGETDDDVDSELVVWRDSDVMSAQEEQAARHGHSSEVFHNDGAHTHSCAHDSLEYNTNPLQNPVLRKQELASTPWYDPLGVFESAVAWAGENESLAKRDDVAGGTSGTNFGNTIGETTGCPNTQKIVYMGVAADCVYTAQYGSTGNATTQIINNWNIASNHYKNTFNVSLGIIELNVQDTTCPATTDPANPWNVPCSNATLNDRLSIFSQWRGAKGNDGAGLWHLMSGCPTGTEVGIAWLGTLCQQSASGNAPSVVSGTAVTTAGRTEWQVVSHEIGHNFGAVHDCTTACSNSTLTCCPASTSTCTNSSSSFLMNPITASGEMQFSPCSVGNICSLMLSGVVTGAVNTTCLLNANAPPPAPVLTLNMCGNGIVEAGEECDPGPDNPSSCCDAQTCKFTANAVCDPTNSLCCTSECQFAPSTQVCRPSIDAQCDTAEMCTGTNATCPTNIFAPNGKSCGSNGLACASGQCTSLDTQCQTIGASLNLHTACPNQGDQSCQVSCQDPTQSNQCVILQSQLIDGSPCGYGGMCMSGNCQPGSLLDTVKGWYTQNLQISIPVTVVGILVVFLLAYLFYICIRNCLRRTPELATRPPRTPGFRRMPSRSSDIAPIITNVAQEGRVAIPASLRPGSPQTIRSRSTEPGEWMPPKRIYDSRSQVGPAANPFADPDVRKNWVDESKWNGPRQS